jgi:hypothetical protein
MEAVSILRAWRLDLPWEATVEIDGCFYAVDFGETVQPRLHHVSGDHCDCSLGSACPAIKEVEEYLKAGGEKAEDPPPGFYPYVPEACPICGSSCYQERRVTSVKRGTGWACSVGGTRHYWQAHTRAFQYARDANPWVFRPAFSEAGEMLYPGLRRDELGG